MRQPKRARGRQRVAALLDAAAVVFAERGYHAATMTEIAARAGAAIGSLYQFFPSKEALAEALLVRYGERLGEALDQIAARAPALSPAALAQALVELMLALRGERTAVLLLLDALDNRGERRQPLRGRMRRQLAQLLLAVVPGLTPARAETMAPVLQQLLKAVPTLAEEEVGGHPGVVAELRRLIAFQIAQTLPPEPGAPAP